jgi:hypothetical protein
LSFTLPVVEEGFISQSLDSSNRQISIIEDGDVHPTLASCPQPKLPLSVINEPQISH